MKITHSLINPTRDLTIQVWQDEGWMKMAISGVKETIWFPPGEAAEIRVSGGCGQPVEVSTYRVFPDIAPAANPTLS
jgi:hypothetical protein